MFEPKIGLRLLDVVRSNLEVRLVHLLYPAHRR